MSRLFSIFLLATFTILNLSAKSTMIVTGQTHEGKYIQVINDNGKIEVSECTISAHCNAIGSFSEESLIELIQINKKNDWKEIVSMGAGAVAAMVPLALMITQTDVFISTSSGDYITDAIMGPFNFIGQMFAAAGGLFGGGVAGITTYSRCSTLLNSTDITVRDKISLIEENLLGDSCPVTSNIAREQKHEEILRSFQQLVELLD